MLLSNSEIKKFDEPPILPSEIRTICFAINKDLENQLEKLRSKANKVGFLLQYGYFRACKKFFQQIKYLLNQYNMLLIY